MCKLESATHILVAAGEFLRIAKQLRADGKEAVSIGPREVKVKFDAWTNADHILVKSSKR